MVGDCGRRGSRVYSNRASHTGCRLFAKAGFERVSNRVSKLRQRALTLSIIPILLFVIGTVGYILIEGWEWGDALYMTAITLSTVGFGEVQPLSGTGRVFTFFLIISGVGTVAYGLQVIGEAFFVEGAAEQWRQRRVMKTIEGLREHVIVCGFGRVGHSTAVALQDSGQQVVVLEREPQLVGQAQDEGFLVVEGDATSDETLKKAGIEYANSLVTCTGDDSVNLFVVLSSRALNRGLSIIARSEAHNESKMFRAGANRVVSPHEIGGKHMANIILRPNVADFFDVVTLSSGVELWLEDLVIGADSPMVGKTVGQTDVRRETGVTLVALIRRQPRETITPDADTVLNAGDELIVLGTREQLAKLTKLAKTPLIP